MLVITSPSNPKIKEAAQLRDGKHRRRSGLFLIEGLRELNRAIASGINIREIFADEHFAAESIVAANYDTYRVSAAVLEKISFGERRDGVVAVARLPDQTWENFESHVHGLDNPLLAVLENIEKPGNVGAVFRSADGAGLDGVLLADRRSDLYNAHTIRNSLGTVFRLPSVESNSAAIIDWLRNNDISIAAARCDGAIPYTDYDFRQPTAMVLGNEADGLSDLWRGEHITSIALPMFGIADSLNISAAAAVLFYEARRQRELYS